MKQVIFVGGSSYSGTTMLDLTLGNDPSGFSCGEVARYLHPTRPHHIRPICGCGNPNCRTWPSILEHGTHQLHETIFDSHRNVQFIVDSSKDVFWIKTQHDRLRRRGIDTKHVLIWKTPLEAAESFKKRGRLAVWEKSWVSYHRLYFSLIPEWTAVRYSEYVSNPASLRTICSDLEIPYFEGKERYWEKQHCILGGNHSARVHLYSFDSDAFARSSRVMSNTGVGLSETRHQTILSSARASSLSDAALVDAVEIRKRRSRFIRPIEAQLRERTNSHDSIPGGLCAPLLLVEAHRGARRLREVVGAVRFRKT
jgi:hypothetical protein